MNPFDLPGPEFLGLYLFVLAIALGIAVYVRWSFHLPDDDPPDESLELGPYEVAYLAGDDGLTINAAIARFIHEKMLAFDSAKGELKRLGKLPVHASPLERAVYGAANGPLKETIKTVRALDTLAPVREKLQRLGLLVADDNSWKARMIATFTVLAVSLFGVIKIVVGMAREKPVAFLVTLCVITAIVALAGFARKLHRSRRGDIALERLKKAGAGLAYSGRLHDDLSGEDLVLAMGLFGVGVIATGPLAPLHTALKPPAGSSGCGSGTSCGSGCGGGCGGGGCGGCGG